MKSIKILKILVLISYMSITLIGTKIAGPLIMFVLIGLINPGLTIDFTMSLLISAAIACWIISIVWTNKIMDKVLLPLTVLPMFYPLIGHGVYLIENWDWISRLGICVFALTTSIFILFLALVFRLLHFKSGRTVSTWFFCACLNEYICVLNFIVWK